VRIAKNARLSWQKAPIVTLSVTLAHGLSFEYAPSGG
jgi:hypothetical protein